jgi:hypothetical protein
MPASQHRLSLKRRGTSRPSVRRPPCSGGLEPNAATAGNPIGSSCKADAGGCLPRPLSDAGVEASCPGCFVGNSCVAAGAVEPGNSCQVCDPQRDPLSWSANDGVSCDDGLFCTVDDICSSSQCSSAARQCDDGVACNGVSTCDEALDACSPGVNQCGSNMACDVESGACVSTCNGCLVNGVCVSSGTEAAGNPCLVCNPALSNAAFSAAPGKSCGSAPSACSGQDSCDGQGRCQPNNLAQNTPCGNQSTSACNQADSCDGNGNCSQRVAANGAPCDDGSFCSVGDRCQGGECFPTGNRNCGAGSNCDEVSNQCQCQGCSIAGICFGAGATNPANACQACDPGRSRTAFSNNDNASCGGGRTCNAQGQCVAVPRQPLGTRCLTAAECSSGFLPPVVPGSGW